MAEESDSWENNVKCFIHRHVSYTFFSVAFNYMSLNEISAKHSKRLGRRELNDAFDSWANRRKIFSIFLVHLRRDLGTTRREIYNLLYM
jgi:hypothetical protein